MKDKIMSAMLMSCLRVTQFLEQEEVEKLDALSKMRMAVHLSMCTACSKYKKQNEVLNELLKEDINERMENYDSKEHTLPTVKKLEIIEQLKIEK